MRVKLFTHNDKDGIGCAILAKQAFSEAVDIEYCNYDNVNRKIENFYVGSEKNNYDRVFITDISISDEVATIIEYYKDKTYYPEVILLDHHKTAEFLNKYDWCNVIENINGEKTCGTSLFYNYLVENILLQNSRAWKWDYGYNLFQFVESVRKYDTWLWKTKYDEIEPKMWNDLLYIMGKENFIEKIMNIVGFKPSLDFTEFDLKLLEYKQRDIDKYIESKDKSIIIKPLQCYQVGFVFAEQYHSELGNTLCELHPELDFVVVINLSQSISYRTIKDIDLSVIAKIYGGGGHPKASGSPITDEVRKYLLKVLF